MQPAFKLIISSNTRHSLIPNSHMGKHAERPEGLLRRMLIDSLAILGIYLCFITNAYLTERM